VIEHFLVSRILKWAASDILKALSHLNGYTVAATNTEIITEPFRSHKQKLIKVLSSDVSSKETG
jgi:hypothetical protein